jgi:hypothetical protein
MDTLIVDKQSQGVSPVEARRALRRGLARTIAVLKLLGTRVWIMKQVPLQIDNPPRMLARAALYGYEYPKGSTLETHKMRQMNVASIIDSLRLPAFSVLDPTSVCFDSTGHSVLTDGKRSFYADEHHLSPFGARALIRPLLEPVFAKMTQG